MSIDRVIMRAPRVRSMPGKAATLAAAAIVCAGLAAPAQAAIFKFYTNFSATVNGAPNDWSYEQRPGAPGSETLLTNGNVPFKIWRNAYGPPGLPGNTFGWDSPSLQNSVPLFFDHQNTQLWWGRGSCCGPVTLPAQSIFMHPGANGVQAVLSFLVPPKPTGQSYTSARIKGQITDVDYNGGDGVTWSVEHQVGASYTTLATGVVYSTVPNPLSSSVVSVGFAVATGDRINIVVDANSNELFDLTALTGEIQLN
jgi:hypothetical protein